MTATLTVDCGILDRTDGAVHAGVGNVSDQLDSEGLCRCPGWRQYFEAKKPRPVEVEIIYSDYHFTMVIVHDSKGKHV